MNFPKDFSLEDNRVCIYVDNIGILGLMSNSITGNYEINGFVFQTHENIAYIIEGRCITTKILKYLPCNKLFSNEQYRNTYNAIKELILDTEHITKDLNDKYEGYRHIKLFKTNGISSDEMYVDVWKYGDLGKRNSDYPSRVHKFDKIVFDIVMNKYDITPQQKWMTQEEHQTQDIMRNLFPTLL